MTEEFRDQRPKCFECPNRADIRITDGTLLCARCALKRREKPK